VTSAEILKAAAFSPASLPGSNVTQGCCKFRTKHGGGKRYVGVCPGATGGVVAGVEGGYTRGRMVLSRLPSATPRHLSSTGTTLVLVFSLLARSTLPLAPSCCCSWGSLLPVGRSTRLAGGGWGEKGAAVGDRQVARNVRGTAAAAACFAVSVAATASWSGRPAMLLLGVNTCAAAMERRAAARAGRLSRARQR